MIDGIPVQRWLFLRPSAESLRRGRLDLSAAFLYFYPATLLRLRRLLQTFKPDVVNLHFPDCQISYVLWARKRFAFRLVVSLHGDEIEHWTPTKLHPRGGLTRLRRILREADAVTACSRYLMFQAIKVESSIAQKAHVIQNGLDRERFYDQSCYRHTRPYVLAYGRLVYKKGFDLLLQAFAQIAHRHPGLDLIIAGEGEEKEQLHTLSMQCGIGDRVYFYGRASQEEIVRLLNGCRLAAVPSRQEPFGIAALEANAAGRPLLATRVGGLPEAAERGDAVNLVSPTVEGIAAGLNEALSSGIDAAIGNRRNGHGSLISWRAVARQYLQVYNGFEASEYRLCGLHNQS